MSGHGPVVMRANGGSVFAAVRTRVGSSQEATVPPHPSILALCVAHAGRGTRLRANDMLKSALISALSACLAAWITLLYQQYWLSPHADLQQHATDTRQPQQESSDIIAPPAIDLAQTLGLGRVLLSRGEFEEAALVYRVAASAAVSAPEGLAEGDAGPRNRRGGEAHHGLGLALLASGRPEDALEACREAERLDTSSAAAASCVGALLTEMGDTIGAVEALRRATERAVLGNEGSETVDVIRGRLGGALLEASRIDEAIAVLADTNNGNAAYNLGVAWQSKGETDKAIISFTRAVELAPNLAAPRVNLGAQLFESGRLPEAEAVLLSALELAHGDPRSLAAAQANLGAVFQRSGRIQEALTFYSQAVDSGAGRSSLMRISKLHQDLGQMEQALEASRRAMLADGDPLDMSPTMQVGLLLESLGNIEEAADHFAIVIQLDAENLEAMTHLGVCQQRLGRHHEALESFLAASRLEPDNPVLYELLLSAVGEAKRAMGEVTDRPMSDDIVVSSERPKDVPAVDASQRRAPRGQVAKETEGTESEDADSADCLSAGRTNDLEGRELPGGKASGQQVSAGGLGAEHSHAAEWEGKAIGEITKASVGGTEGAATAEAVTGTGQSPLDTGRCSGCGDASTPADSSTTKSIPANRAGASVRHDSAETRRQSEIFRKGDAGAEKTRELFGESILEGSKGTIPLVTGLHGIGGEPEGRGYGAANGPEKGVPGVGDDPARRGVREQQTSDGGAMGEVLAGSAGAEPEPLVAAAAGVGKGTGHQLPASRGKPPSDVSGMTKSASPIGDIPVKVEIPTDSLRGEELPTDGADAESGTGGRGLRANGQEQGRLHIGKPVPLTEATGQMAAHSPKETNGGRPGSVAEREVGADAISAVLGDSVSSPAAENINEVSSSGIGSGSRLSEGDKALLAAAGEVILGEGDGARLHVDTTFATANDAVAAGGGNSVDAPSEAASDEDVIRVSEERVMEPVGREHDGVMDIVAPPAAVEAVEDNAGEGIDQSTTAANKSDSVSHSSPEDSISTPTLGVQRATAEEAIGDKLEASSRDESTATGTSLEGMAFTTGKGEEGVGERETADVQTTGGENDGTAEHAVSVSKITADAGVASSDTDGIAGGLEMEASNPGPAAGVETSEVVNTGDAASAADTRVDAVVVSEEDTKRARAKAKLGLAKLKQGQARTAVSMFEKAASIDPRWWGGFYYAALAHDSLGNTEAAATALVSALGVPPAEAGEVAELAALSSKVLASLDGEKGQVARVLQTAMDASGLSFGVAPPEREPLSASRPERNSIDSPAPRGGGGGAGSGFGRTTGMGGGAGGAEARGGGAEGITGLEADFANEFGGGGASATPSRKGGGEASPDTKRVHDDADRNSGRKQARWPFSGKGRAGGDGGGGTSSGSNHGTAPVSEDTREYPQDLGGTIGGTGIGGRYRDNDGASGGDAIRDVPSESDARKVRWGDWGESGGGKGGVGDPSATVGAGWGGGGGSSHFKIDPKASTEEILESIGLDSGFGFGPAGGVGARTPEGRMSGSVSGDEGGNKKKGLFGGFWNSKGKEGKR